MTNLRTCPKCQVEFDGTGNRQKYCSSDCKSESLKNMPRIVCEFCKKEYSAKGIHSHVWLNHKDGKDHHLKNRHVRNKPAWNSGLKKETDSRVASFGKTIAKNAKIRKENGWHRISSMSSENRKKLSISQSLKNRGGKSKWFVVNGYHVQGTWEKSIAEKMCLLNIEWTKLKCGKDIFEYRLNDKDKHYTPDFFLPAHKFYLEIKGYWWGNDKEKMDIVIHKYPEKRFVIIEKEKYSKLLESETYNEFLTILEM